MKRHRIISERYLYGTGCAVLQLGTSELVALAVPGATSPTRGLGRSLIDATPGPLIDVTVATVEDRDKPLLTAALVAELLALGGGAGHLTARGRPGGALLLAHGLVAGAAAARRPDGSPAASLLAGGLGGIAGGLSMARGPVTLRPARLSAAAAAVATAALALRRRREQRHDRRRREVVLPRPARPAPLPAASLEVPGISPLFTPAHEFYVTDVAFPSPRVDPRRWRLRVHGLVARELELRLEDLLDMPLTELDATLACVHNPVGGPRVGNARWLGVPLAELLTRAGVRPGGEQLLARSVDGFTAGIPVEDILGGRSALVAVGLGGQPLRVENGFPARLLVPGLWGADANTKWLSELELTTWAAAKDYWDARGWPRRPTPVRPGSRIDVPRDRGRIASGTATIAGVAWAPPAGVAGVEVCVDDGPWLPAELGPELAPTAWRQWRLDWDARPGEHELRVRAVGRDGPQPAQPEPPYPRGSAGYHRVRVWCETESRPENRWDVVRRRSADTAAAARRRLALAAMAPSAWARGSSGA